jgi:hypothetical protein
MSVLYRKYEKEKNIMMLVIILIIVAYVMGYGKAKEKYANVK